MSGVVMNDFVKSATTSTPVAKSQADIIAMLGRYGASGFGFHRIGTVVEVTFHLRGSDGGDRTVVIPVDLCAVAVKLDSPALQRHRKTSKQATHVSDEQTERVAWRILHLWIDAALSAVALGAQSLEEAFFAHLVVKTEGGASVRLVEYVARIGAGSQGVLPAPSRFALPSGSEPR